VSLLVTDDVDLLTPSERDLHGSRPVGIRRVGLGGGLIALTVNTRFWILF